MNRRELLKLFAFVPLLAAIPVIDDVDSEKPLEPIGEYEPPNYSGPRRVIGFSAEGIDTRARVGSAWLARMRSGEHILNFTLNAMGGRLHWSANLHEAIYVPEGHEVMVHRSDSRIIARALMQLPGRAQFTVLEAV